MQFVTASFPSGQRIDYRQDLEAGNVLYFPATPFVIPQEDQEFLRGINFSGGAIHKNIAYRPTADRVTGMANGNQQAVRLLEIMRNYSRAVTRFTAQFLPEYAASWKLDYASFRPLEEHGRNLPLNKRNDLLHTDAFPSRPTNGDLILRIFTNIDPSKSRDWITTDPFPVLAQKYARDAGLLKIAASAHSTTGRFLGRSNRLLKQIGLPVVPRSAYDRFMLHFHDYLKRNPEFQANCPKYRFDFPPGSTWLTFTDVVPHSVHAGQHALEQTFIVARNSLLDPEQSPVGILERLCGQPLLAS